jgi:hypothetical protein
MKVLLDIQDSKASSLLEVLKGLPYVKTKSITKPTAELLEDARTSVEQMNQVKKGKIKLKLTADFLNEI